MLTINIPDAELFDDGTQMFFKSQGATLLLEHSLVSLSKWESEIGRPFLDGEPKSTEHSLAYVRCMNLAPVPFPEIYKRVSDADMRQVSEYIDSKQTATWFTPDPNARPSQEIITSEVIYYWMIAHSIPFEAQYWHLNRLLTLIKVCNEKNKPAKRSKMPSREQMSSRRMLNEQRKAQLGTQG